MELNSRLEKYIKEFDEDVQLTISNIKEKSLMVSSYQSKWIRYYFQEKHLNQKLKDAKLEYTKQHANKLSFKPTQTVMPQIQEQDQNIVKLNNEIKNSELCIEFIEKSMAVLEKMNFQVKNVIDIIKLEQS